MRYSNINGIVLKSINFKDSDKIFSILTREMGKVSVLARGVRKISSKRSGNLDTLNLIAAKIYESGKGFIELEEVKTVNSFIEIKKSYEATLVSYYLVELVYRTLEDGADSEEVLNLLIYCLKKLSSEPSKLIETVSFFELRFMGILGYDLNTHTCVKCGKDILDNLEKYILDFGRGGFLCGSCLGIGKSVSIDIFRWVKEAKVHGLDKVSSVTNIKDLKNTTRAFLNTHLESRLKSLELV